MLAAALVFALDDKHKYDVDWLKETAKKIDQMRKNESVPEDCREFIDMLQLEQQQLCFATGSELAGGELMHFHSEMCFQLGSSLVQDANAWCVLYKFKTQDLLPSNRLPEDGIVPFLLLTPPKKKTPIHFAEIPSKYYQV
ncbi:hypothetical protein [Anaerotignum sp.]|uniref:hypothetical protein n=1 Tax=Anaerotignum sp. TaxID=2039241 RepID=UPI0028AF9DA0|nr:hypothetical protein [Anaerotignum sp.]